jgi:hypothetical protein
VDVELWIDLYDVRHTSVEIEYQSGPNVRAWLDIEFVKRNAEGKPCAVQGRRLSSRRRRGDTGTTQLVGSRTSLATSCGASGARLWSPFVITGVRLCDRAMDHGVESRDPGG